MCDPDEDILYMAAYMQSMNEMKAVENFEIEKQVKKNAVQNGRPK